MLENLNLVILSASIFSEKRLIIVRKKKFVLIF